MVLSEIIVYHKVTVCIFSVIHNYIYTVKCYFICYQKGNLFATEVVNFVVYHPLGEKTKQNKTKNKAQTPNQTSGNKGIVMYWVDRVKLKKKKKSPTKCMKYMHMQREHKLPWFTCQLLSCLWLFHIFPA